MGWNQECYCLKVGKTKIKHEKQLRYDYVEAAKLSVICERWSNNGIRRTWWWWWCLPLTPLKVSWVILRYSSLKLYWGQQIRDLQKIKHFSFSLLGFEIYFRCYWSKIFFGDMLNISKQMHTSIFQFQLSWSNRPEPFIQMSLHCRHCRGLVDLAYIRLSAIVELETHSYTLNEPFNEQGK